MKVISQLIHHFWSRGALSLDQVEYLVRQGFVRADALEGLTTAREAEPGDSPHERHLDAVADELIRRTAGRRGKAGPRKNAVGMKGLCVSLRREFDRRSGVLAALVRLAGVFETCEGWDAAAVIIRRVPPDAWQKGLCDLLGARPALNCDLWRAADPEPFHALADDLTQHGPALQAFRALLKVGDAGQLGKYSWILQAPEMATVANLLQVHRRLLAAVHSMWIHEPGVMAHVLHHGVDIVLFWAFVLLYNTARTTTADGGPGTAQESGPLELPDNAVWRQATTSALLMDPAILPRLLEMEAYQEPLVRPWAWKVAPTSRASDAGGARV